MVKKSKSGKIIIPVGMKPRPRPHEIEIAEILAKHLKTDIEFIPTTNRNTPDFLIDGTLWELKSPQGTGKNNIQRQLQYAVRQSSNVILDANRSKMHVNKIKREVEHQFKIIRSVKRLMFVSKDKTVIELTK